MEDDAKTQVSPTVSAPTPVNSRFALLVLEINDPEMVQVVPGPAGGYEYHVGHPYYGVRVIVRYAPGVAERVNARAAFLLTRAHHPTECPCDLARVLLGENDPGLTDPTGQGRLPM